MPTAQELLAGAIRPALQHIGHHSAAAEQLVLGTAAQESHLTYRRQLGGGPARGLFQMEGATHDDIWNTYLRYKTDLKAKVEQLVPGRAQPSVEELVNNDKYAAAMCRIRYLRAPGAIPAAGDLAGMAKYWKDHYNTYLGAGKPSEYIENWNRYVAGKVDFASSGTAPVGTTGRRRPASAGRSARAGRTTRTTWARSSGCSRRPGSTPGRSTRSSAPSP